MPTAHRKPEKAKKDDLETVGPAQPPTSADTPPAGTDAEPAAAPLPEQPPAASPVEPLAPEAGVVGTHNAPHGLAALTGFFARVIHGEHEGRYGVVQGADKVGKDGLPVSVALRTRDDNDEIISVPYDHLERAEAGGR